MHCQTNDAMFFSADFKDKKQCNMRSFLLNCPYCQCPSCWTSALHGLNTHMVFFVLQMPQALLTLLQLQIEGKFLLLCILILLPEAWHLFLDLHILKATTTKKEREWECRNLSEKAMSLVNNTHCVCPGARSFFRSRALFCDMPANESQLYFLSLSTRMGITSFCSSLILLLLCSSWLVALWCSSCRTLSWFSRSVCVFSRVLTVLLRLVFCFLELWAGCRFRFQRDYIIGLQKELFSYLKVKCGAGY